MEQLMEYNKKLLYNILPDHVAQHFLAQQAKKNDVSVKRWWVGFLFSMPSHIVCWIFYAAIGLNCIIVFFVLRLCASVGFSRIEFQVT